MQYEILEPYISIPKVCAKEHQSGDTFIKKKKKIKERVERI